MGHPAQPLAQALYLGAVVFTVFCNILSQDSGCQVLSWPAGWGAPHRAGATVTCRERDVPPNPPMAAMLGPVCGHQGWPEWVRAVFSLRVTNKVSTSQHGHLTTPVLGTSQATSSLAWKAGAVLGEQGAGDRASWGVGRGAQTPRWTKLNKGKGRAAWESRAECLLTIEHILPFHHLPLLSLCISRLHA